MPNPLLDLGILSICYTDVCRFHTVLHLFQYPINTYHFVHISVLFATDDIMSIIYSALYVRIPFLLFVVTFSYNEFISDISNSGHISCSVT